jgi:hypothetical protein
MKHIDGCIDCEKEIPKLKADVKDCLRQLRRHSPMWVKLINRYIRYLERGAAGK